MTAARRVTAVIAVSVLFATPPLAGERRQAPQGGPAAALPFTTAGAFGAVTRAELVHGIFKAGVIVKDFDALLAAFTARGVAIAYGPYPATESQRANVIIRDNAGNLLQFCGGSRR